MIDIRFLSPFLLDQKTVNTDNLIISFKTIYLAKIITANFAYYNFNYAITKNNLDLKPYK